MRLILLGVAIAVLLTSAVLMTSRPVVADTIVVRDADLAGASPPAGADKWTVLARRGEGAPATKKAIGTCYDGYCYGGTMPPLGYGSFWEKLFEYYTNSGDDYLPRVRLGTNKLSGVALNDITSLNYWACLTARAYHGQPLSGGPHGQPPMLEIYTDSGATSQMRIFVYHPFGQGGRPADPDTELGVWQQFDALALDGYWEMLNSSTGNYFGNWDWVKNRYGDLDHPMHIITPPTAPSGTYYESADYPNYCEPGTGLNIKIGSYKLSETNRSAWWKQACGVEGYVDQVTVGVSDGQGGSVETTYDFDIPGSPVFMSNRSTRDPIVVNVPDPLQANIPRGPRHTFPFALYGTVTANNYAPTTFEIDDGSGKPIKVMCFEGHLVGIGQYVRVQGIFNNSVVEPDPPLLYIRAIDIMVYTP